MLLFGGLALGATVLLGSIIPIKRSMNRKRKQQSTIHSVTNPAYEAQEMDLNELGNTRKMSKMTGTVQGEWHREHKHMQAQRERERERKMTTATVRSLCVSGGAPDLFHFFFFFSLSVKYVHMELLLSLPRQKSVRYRKTPG